jgi:hypothetical protein
MFDTSYGSANAVQTTQLTLREINQRNREYWGQQNSLRAARMADRVIFQTATRDLTSEEVRQIPVYYRKTLEKALEDAAGAKERCDEQAKGQFQTEFSRKGGRAQKFDPLQQFILEKVRSNLNMTEPMLLDCLRENHDFDIDGEEISFGKANGATKSVAVSALKDRLHRAKKKINSR